MATTTKKSTVPAKAAPPATVVRQLAAHYKTKGYVRRQDPKRVKKEGHQVYKKGDEIRIVAATRKELAEIRQLLTRAGFKLGKAFPKANQFAQPIYGTKQVSMFLKMVRGK